MTDIRPYEFTLDVPLPEDAPVRKPSASITIFQLSFCPIGTSVYIPEEAFQRTWLSRVLPGVKKHRSVHLPQGTPHDVRFHSKWDDNGCRVWITS